MGNHVRTKMALFLFLVWIGSAEVTMAANPTPTPYGYVRVLVSSAGIRKGPGFNYSVDKYAKMNEEFAIYGQAENGTWLLVDPDRQTWIAAKQVERITPNSTDFSRTNQQSNYSKDPISTSPPISFSPDFVPNEVSNAFLISAKERLQYYINLGKNSLKTIGVSIPEWAVFGLYIWGVSLLVPLVTLKIRWLIGALVFGVTLGPLGWIISIVIALMIIFGSSRIKDSSPREFFEDMIGWGPVKAFIVILFLALTAVSILGGVIIFAYLALFYGIILILLPGKGRNWKRSSSPIDSSRLNNATTTSSEEPDTNRSSYDDYPDDVYRGIYDQNDDQNDDHDDDSGNGSIMDGWLIKW